MLATVAASGDAVLWDPGSPDRGWETMRCTRLCVAGPLWLREPTARQLDGVAARYPDADVCLTDGRAVHAFLWDEHGIPDRPHPWIVQALLSRDLNELGIAVPTPPDLDDPGVRRIVDRWDEFVAATPPEPAPPKPAPARPDELLTFPDDRPLPAWRWFKLDSDGVLCSPYGWEAQRYRPGINIARCTRNLFSHEAPVPDCSCGFAGYWGGILDALLNCLRGGEYTRGSSRPYVLCRVALSGRVIVSDPERPDREQESARGERLRITGPCWIEAPSAEQRARLQHDYPGIDIRATLTEPIPGVGGALGIRRSISVHEHLWRIHGQPVLGHTHAQAVAAIENRARIAQATGRARHGESDYFSVPVDPGTPWPGDR